MANTARDRCSTVRQRIPIKIVGNMSGRMVHVVLTFQVDRFWQSWIINDLMHSKQINWVDFIFII